MHKSLRLKLTLMLMFIVLGIVICSTLISGLFLGDFYMMGKQKALIETYHDVNRLYMLNDAVSSDERFSSSQDGTDFSSLLGEDFENNLERMSEGRSTSIVIFRAYDFRMLNGSIVAQTIYSSMDSESDEQNKMVTDYWDAQTDSRTQTLRVTDKYQIQKMYIQRLSNEYVYLSASLDNGDNILIRSSIDSIERSVNLANQFFMYVSLLMLIVGTLVVYFISRNITQPILGLAQIATRMSELDFTTKYQVNRQDEIGILGNSMNYLSSTLETTLGELKSANAKLQKDLEKKTQIDNMRTEFLSNVSHELKTPIALIQGYAEGLMENINDDEESRNFYCEVIMDEAAKMNNIVKKLLDLNQLEFGDNNLNMEHFDIVSVIQNLLASSDILFKQKQVSLEFNVTGPVYVWADVYTVEEVFNNYLSNAFNHVDGDRIIRVDITKDAWHVRVCVFNTGQPIPEDDLPKIWGKFYKVDKARTREYGGSGVGLSIVKASMELLGQKYGVENKENGVEFWFELDATNSIEMN